jgi:divalent metal cation (Fe/Co/Zn/Cd) transporter
MERYFWSLLAAVGIFVLGAGFSAYEGITALGSGGKPGSAMWAFVVLAVSFVFEGSSFAKAVLQLRRNAGSAGSPMLRHLRHDADPALRAVVLVAARVDLADDLTPEEIELAADQVDSLVRDRFPEVRHVFLDPTPDQAEDHAENRAR